MKKIISIILAAVLACSMMSFIAFADSLKGDVNGDDNVSAVDARIILRCVAGLYIPENTDSYDVNGDGNITAVDARIVLRIVAGLEQPETPPQDNEKPETPPQDNEKPETPPQDNEKPETPPQDNEKPETPPQDNEKPETPPQDNEKPEIPATDEEKLEKFVELMNSVKTDASAVTLVSTTMYECQEPVVGFALSAIISKEELAESIKDSYGTEEVNETYTGEDIAAAFPPTGTTCSLTMNDIKSIEVKEGLTSYTYVVVVKGEKNPTRGKGVGAVATIVTQEELQASIDENEDLKGLVTMDAVYKDVTVKAEVDKETGKIIRYTADSPLIMSTNMAGQFAFSVGLGIIENWTIAYSSTQEETDAPSTPETPDVSVGQQDNSNNGETTIIPTQSGVLIISDTVSISNATIDGDVYITSTGIASFTNVTVMGDIYCYGILYMDNCTAQGLNAITYSYMPVSNTAPGQGFVTGSGSFNSMTLGTSSLSYAFNTWGKM